MPVLPNPRHEKFAHELAQGRSASSAYRAAGFSGHRAPASRLANRADVSLEHVLRELAYIAFGNILDILQWQPRVLWTGTPGARTRPGDKGPDGFMLLLGSDDLDRGTLAAIADLRLSDTGVRVKLHDKRKALVALGRHLGMFDKRHHVSAKPAPPIESAKPRSAREQALSILRILSAGSKQAGGSKAFQDELDRLAGELER
jgi:phage terminase small subunit